MRFDDLVNLLVPSACWDFNSQPVGLFYYGALCRLRDLDPILDRCYAVFRLEFDATLNFVVDHFSHIKVCA